MQTIFLDLISRGDSIYVVRQEHLSVKKHHWTICKQIPCNLDILFKPLCNEQFNASGKCDNLLFTGESKDESTSVT